MKTAYIIEYEVLFIYSFLISNLLFETIADGGRCIVITAFGLLEIDSQGVGAPLGPCVVVVVLARESD